MMRLSSLISDGMILQRDVENSIWGYSEKGRTVELSFENFQVQTICGDDGYFELMIPEMPAGGPWEFRMTDGEEELVIHDVLFGDVFLLGGQSNMELPIERVMDRYADEILHTSEDEKDR